MRSDIEQIVESAISASQSQDVILWMHRGELTWLTGSAEYQGAGNIEVLRIPQAQDPYHAYQRAKVALYPYGIRLQQ